MVVSTEDESDSDQKNNKVGPGTFSIGRDHSSMNGQREGFLALSSTMSALVNARHAPTNRVWNDSEVDPSSPRETKHLPPSPLVTPPVGMVFRSTERGDAVASHCDSSHLAEGGKHPSHSRDNSTGSSAPDNSTGSTPRPNKKGIPHIYHDYSQVPDASGYVRKKTGGVTQPFPEKLHEMLHAIENDQDARPVVSWLSHGRAFIVHKPKEFTKEIMPKFFKQTKLTSFQRQLNLYGFRRITQGSDAGAYYHEMFLKGRPSLCQHMVRQKVKGTGHKQPADASSEPNFYAMPSLDSPEHLPPSPSTHFQYSIASILPINRKSSTRDDTSNLSPKKIPVHGFVVERESHEGPSSPSMSSVQGAAHLLTGIASGLRFPQLPPPTVPFLPSTIGLQDEEKTESECSMKGDDSGRDVPKERTKKVGKHGSTTRDQTNLRSAGALSSSQGKIKGRSRKKQKTHRSHFT